jgi:hypothetical protein
VLHKFEAVILKNPDLERVKMISSFMDGADVNPEAIKPDLTAARIASFKYAPLTSVDAERSFSMHKAMLSDRRHSMSVTSLEMGLVSHYEL